MRIEGRRYRDEWIPNYYPSRKVGPDHHLRLSRVGTTQVLSATEDGQLSEIFMDEALYRRLERTGHIVTSGNAQKVLESLKVWHTKSYRGPDLHIVVLTKRCNLNCTYCHMNPEPIGAAAETFDMQPEVAREVIRFALSVPVDAVYFEFQGGEPFLNFPCMKYFVEEAKRQGAEAGKEVDFSVVSNLMVVKDEHMEFCREHGITVSYSLNGPPEIHDLFRKSRNGAGSYDAVVKRLRYFQDRFGDLLSTSPLCVVGSDNAKDLLRTIDFFHDQGFKGVAVIKLKHLGNAVKQRLAFDIREFLKHYLAALDYIYEKNQRLQESYSERMLRVLLSKVILPEDIGFVDWRNPCGDFSGAVTYDFDGEILPSDEVRSLRPAFALGNVKEKTYDELVRVKETFLSMNMSLRDRDPECRECAFNPYCGVLPVLDYARTGNPTPVPYESEECLQTIAVLDWLFARLIEDPIPLFRMLPGMDQAIVAACQRQAGREAARES